MWLCKAVVHHWWAVHKRRYMGPAVENSSTVKSNGFISACLYFLNDILCYFHMACIACTDGASPAVPATAPLCRLSPRGALLNCEATSRPVG